MKILIVGLGSIAKKHIKAILQLDESAEFFALRSNSNSSEVENITNIYTLKDIDMAIIDFIIISNPTSEHFSVIRKLEKYNKPLFIEKPLFSEISEETTQLVKDIEKKELPTYIACNLRFLEAIKELKIQLENVRINEVNVYCGSYLPDWRPGIDFRTVYSANKEMGGGVHIDLIHELDYVYWLFGQPTSTQSYFSNQSSLGISAYDYANYLWHFDGFSVSIVLNYYRKDNKRTIEVVTNKGTFLLNLLNNTIEFNNECIFASPQKIADTYYDQMKFFIDSVLLKKNKFNTIIEANTILELCMKG